MDSHLESELDRLVRNATARREILLVSGLLRARVRRALNVVSGILALSSAGAIAAVLAKVAGQESTQIAAAISAGASGVTSLLVANYFEESDALNRLTGASKYLVLRDNVYRLLIRPGLTDEQRLTLLAEMQAEYARLDPKMRSVCDATSPIRTAVAEDAIPGMLWCSASQKRW